MRVTLRLVAVLLSFLLAGTVTMSAQTSTKAAVSGSVSDPQGGVVPGATVVLRDQATNELREAVTNADGRYDFLNLAPGIYELSARLAGFRTVTIRNIRADVARAVTQDLRLEIGDLAEEVTVVAAASLALQRQDASVGTTFESGRITHLPNVTRDATRLLLLQPAATPGGEVAGSRSDQSTYLLDGVDMSDRAFGAFRTGQTPIIPMPVEAIEEFRGTVTNANASFTRSSGGQFVLITKRGTNDFSGSLYGYHQNSALNANSWTNLRLGQAKPSSRDTRVGTSVGGPVIRNRTFFFALYEGRRNPGSANITRIVPTPSLRQGLLRFRDAAGVVQTVNPRDIDPRGIGASPVILEYFGLYPQANDVTVGDGLNTSGFSTTLATTTRDDLGIARLDHSFAGNWHMDGSFKLFNRFETTADQVSLLEPRAVTAFPHRPRSLSVGLTGVLGASVTNEIRFGWIGERPVNDRVSPSALLPQLNMGIELAGPLLNELIDIGFPLVRKIDTFQYTDNLTWLKGRHTLQAGVTVRQMSAFDIRATRPGTAGGVNPVASVTSRAFNLIPVSQRPSFILPADVVRYNQLYAALLGQVEIVEVLQTRNGNLQPNPFGTPIISDSRLSSLDTYVSDTWNIRPDLTLGYGLTYNLLGAPVEKEGRHSVAIYLGTGDLVNPQEYLQNKSAAAARGEVFNPDLAWVPVADVGGRVLSLDKNNVGGRASVAWTPTASAGLMGALFGERKGVLRGGYALVYDRINVPTLVPIPTVSTGFSNGLSVQGPRNANGEPFRIGIDGPIPMPAPLTGTSPFVPHKPYGETLGFNVDPFLKVPWNHSFSLSYQRVLPGDLAVEAGYVGKLGRDLLQGVSLTQAPYMFRDNASGQTFADAFDRVAAELRRGVAPAAVTPQPWFENLLVRLPAGSRTRALAAQQSGNIITGSLNNLFTFIDGVAREPFNNTQVGDLAFRTSIGRSTYHALLASVRKRLSAGLTFDVNYTYSTAKDQLGLTQDALQSMPNSFVPDAEYGPAAFDLTHVVNANWLWQMPFGGGDSALWSGWYVGGILRAASGTALSIVQGSQAWGGGGLTSPGSSAVLLDAIESGLHSGIPGSGGVGTAGDPSRGGSGLNIFADPEQAASLARRIRLGEDMRSSRGRVRGPGFWQVDLTFGRDSRINGDIGVRVSVDVINAFNRVNFSAPALSLLNLATFGVISSQRIDENQAIVPRRVQIGLHVSF